METLENHMVLDWILGEINDPPWEEIEKLKGPGYREIGSNIFVPKNDAYNYAMERVFLDEDLKREFVDWFYSADWVFEDGK